MPTSSSLTTATALMLLCCAGACSDPGGGGGGSGGGATASGSTASTGAGATGGGDASSGTTVATSGTSSGGDGGSGGGAGGAGGGGGAPPAELERACAGHVYACGNAVDDDGDGVVDADDPDCVGSCDGDEHVLLRPLPACDAPPCHADCAFDGDCGTGNDGCSWDYRCDPGSVAPAFDPTGDPTCDHDPDAQVLGLGSCGEAYEEQPAECHATCGPVVPNGCDCFGCCELPGGSGRFARLLSHGEDAIGDPVFCSTATMDDPTICRACEPVPSCFNPCDACETCLGAPPPGEACTQAQQCPGGEPACGRPGQERCPAETYCVTGCCQPLPE